VKSFWNSPFPVSWWSFPAGVQRLSPALAQSIFWEKIKMKISQIYLTFLASQNNFSVLLFRNDWVTWTNYSSDTWSRTQHERSGIKFKKICLIEKVFKYHQHILGQEKIK
jgi:hypothetical protein